MTGKGKVLADFLAGEKIEAQKSSLDTGP